MDRFRVESTAFKRIPWRTDILCVRDGINELQDIPELSISPFICLGRDT